MYWPSSINGPSLPLAWPPVDVVVVEVPVLRFHARHGELPEEFAGGLVEAHDESAAGLLQSRRVAEAGVVGADENLAAGDGRVAVGLASELGDPLDILGRDGDLLVALGLLAAGAEGGGNTLFVGGEVALVAAAPLGPVGGNRLPRQRRCHQEPEPRQPGTR
jgi:hypothetical protein